MHIKPWLFCVLAALLLSCQSRKQTVTPRLSPAATPQATTSSHVQTTIEDEELSVKASASSKALSIQQIRSSLERKIAKKPELRPVIQKILAQPEKFDAIAEACSSKHNSEKRYSNSAEFISFLKLSNEQYILYLPCYLGAYQPGGVYFLVSRTTGIQPEPLVLTKLVDYETGDPKEIPIADQDGLSISGYPRFEQDKKELSLIQRCDGPWSCFSEARYKFINDRFVLQEYITGSRKLNSNDRRYTTFQFIRSPGGWISSGAMKCREAGSETCTKIR